MRNKVTDNICHLSPLCKCLFSSLWKFIVKLVVCAAKVHIKIEFPNIFLLFIENLCFCSLKIAVCVPKIPIGRKKLKIPIRLKISVRSENPYLKISVHQWASRPEWCKCSGHLKGLQAAPDAKQESDKGRATKGEPERCRNTRPPKESRRAKTKIFLLYI